MQLARSLGAEIAGLGFVVELPQRPQEVRRNGRVLPAALRQVALCGTGTPAGAQFHKLDHPIERRSLFIIDNKANIGRNTGMPQSRPRLQLDEVGPWSELKLEILSKYASAYSRILREHKLRPVYIDGFAGAGQHISKRTSELIPGSPLNALQIDPPFEEFYLVDLRQERVENLRKLTTGNPKVHIYSGDSNKILATEVFPKVRYEDYRRALCVLDPYGLNLDWSVINTAAQLGTIEIFLNFPVLGMNRNVLWRSEGASAKSIARMSAFWGDESWRSVAYRTDTTLFGEAEKQSNESLAAGFRERLQKVAGFKHVPEPAPMRNSVGAVVYYLFFAAHKPVAASIVADILSRYRKQGRIHG